MMALSALGLCTLALRAALGVGEELRQILNVRELAGLGGARKVARQLGELGLGGGVA